MLAEIQMFNIITTNHVNIYQINVEILNGFKMDVKLIKIVNKDFIVKIIYVLINVFQQPVHKAHNVYKETVFN